MREPSSRWAALLIGVSAACLVAGVTLPVLRLRSLGFLASDQSIVAASGALLASREWWLGAVIGLFSIVLPGVKLAILSLRLRPGAAGGGWLIPLVGKWSMLDVLVVAATIGCVQLGILGRAAPGPGIYWFFLSVALSLAAATILDREPPGTPKKTAFWPAALHAVLFTAGVSLPLLGVEKWLFWQQGFSLVEALPAMIGEGHWLLPLLLGSCVIAIPGLLAAARLAPAWGGGALFRNLSHWNMLDVFVMALLLVGVKLWSETQVSFRAGFWCLLAAVLVDWTGAYERGNSARRRR